MWTRVSRFGVGTSSGLLWIRWWTFGLHKMWEILWIADELVAYREGRGPVMLISTLVRYLSLIFQLIRIGRYKNKRTETDFAEYNQQYATFLNLFISVRRSTCLRRFFRPSSGAQNCTYSITYLSDQYVTLYVQFWAPDDGRKNCLKHVERPT